MQSEDARAFIFPFQSAPLTEVSGDLGSALKDKCIIAVSIRAAHRSERRYSFQECELAYRSFNPRRSPK